jgi:hypothetical protein
VSSVSSSTWRTTRDETISTCNATIVELERVGIVSIGMRYTEQGWQCSRNNFNTFSPMLSNGWCLTASLLATPDQATLPGAGFKGNMSLPSFHSPRWRVRIKHWWRQFLFDARKQARGLATPVMAHGSHGTVGAMMHMAELTASRGCQCAGRPRFTFDPSVLRVVDFPLLTR